MAQTAADVFLERLMAWGVDTVFGLPGDGINGIWEALRKRKDEIRYVHVRHEEVGAMAAVGYAKFTGRLGVCLATAGPGAIHLANGLLDSRLEQAPVLAVTGMTYHDLTGTSYLQDYDTDYLYSNLALYNQRIMGPAHVVNVVDLACRTALSRRGPAHIAFPIDYQAADAGDLLRFKRNVPGHTTTAFRAPRATAPEQELRRAAELLSQRGRIAILAGAGARGAGEELERVAETLGAPVIKASLGKDCLPDDSPFVTGGIGVIGTRPSQEAMEGCDGLLIVGSTMPYIEFYPAPRDRTAGVAFSVQSVLPSPPKREAVVPLKRSARGATSSTQVAPRLYLGDVSPLQYAPLMLRHVNLLTWKDGREQGAIDALAEHLSGYAATIPEIRDLSFGPDLGLGDRNADFAIIVDFDDEEAFSRYLAHPAHGRMVGEFLKPIVASRQAVQFSAD